MKKFYETYMDMPKRSALLRGIRWTNKMVSLSRDKSIEEREFYLKISKKDSCGLRGPKR
jgi:hypothetical protein